MAKRGNKNKEKKDQKRNLTGLQELFCQRYTTHWNATRATKEAGYSKKSAMEQGYANLQIPSVKARIADLTEHTLKELGITRERVLQEYARIAYVDPAEAYDDNGNLFHIKNMPEDVRRALHKTETFYESSPDDDGVKVITGKTTKVEWAPKKAALDSLGKFLGLAPEKIEHSGPDGKPIEFKELSNLTDAQIDARIAALSKTKEPKR